MNNLNRRTFLKTVGLATAETLVGPNVHLLAEEQAEAAKAVSPNDTIQFALIGAGIRGQGITRDGDPGSRSEVGRGMRYLPGPARPQQRAVGTQHFYHGGLQGDSGSQGH